MDEPQSFIVSQRSIREQEKEQIRRRLPYLWSTVVYYVPFTRVKYVIQSEE